MSNLLFGPASLVRGTDFGRLFLFGHSGVDLFFVLSGFIIMYNHIRDAKTLAGLRRFALKRIVRIYPPVMITVLLCVALLPAMRWITADPAFFTFDAAGALSSLFLVPATCAMCRALCGRCRNEVYFYAVFCLSYLSVTLFIAAMDFGRFYRLRRQRGSACLRSQPARAIR